jgi:amino-acid N-acetyltransferase
MLKYDHSGSNAPAEDAAPVTIRAATIPDIPDLLALIGPYAADGILLPRTEFEMAECIRDFVVAHAENRLIGCGALHFYTPTSAEVRSLAVDPSLKTKGIGRRIVEALQDEAARNSLSSIFAFTYVPDFFLKLGFDEVDRGELPLKAWKDCLRCPKFQCCDEVPMLKKLKTKAVASAPSLVNCLPVLPSLDPPVVLPTIKSR